VVYVVLTAVSGAVLAGLLMQAVVRALAATGVLQGLASGRAVRR
jgi:energy-coupling factor transport system substrate-specific component